MNFKSRNCFTPPSVPSRMSPFTTIAKAGRRVLLPFTSKGVVMVPRRSNSTTIGLLMEVSIACFPLTLLSSHNLSPWLLPNDHRATGTRNMQYSIHSVGSVWPFMDVHTCYMLFLLCYWLSFVRLVSPFACSFHALNSQLIKHSTPLFFTTPNHHLRQHHHHYGSRIPIIIPIIISTERPMKIEIVVDPSRPAPPASLASRVAPAPAVPVETAPRTGGGRPRRGRGGGGVRGRKRKERPNKSVADLDAEMEDYTASNAPAAAA